MKKHSSESSRPAPLSALPSNGPAKPRVRYEGFEAIEGGRRLTFSVKSVHDGSVEITIDIPNAVFTTVRGVSVQDAAPMFYEKIVSLLANEETVNSKNLCLTEADIRHYIERHIARQKRTYWNERKRRSDIAA